MNGSENSEIIINNFLMRIQKAFVVALLPLMTIPAVSQVSDEINGSHQNKNQSVAIVENGEIKNLDNGFGERQRLTVSTADSKTNIEKKIEERNSKRLRIYKSKLERFEGPKGKVEILVTGYSSTPDQTWGDPFTTASGTRVHDGTMACPSQYPFGTKVKIEKMGTFVCEDRGGDDSWKPL